jgi:hypothetical protein
MYIAFRYGRKTPAAEFGRELLSDDWDGRRYLRCSLAGSRGIQALEIT